VHLEYSEKVVQMTYFHYLNVYLEKKVLHQQQQQQKKEI